LTRISLIAATLFLASCNPKSEPKPSFVCPKCAQPTLAILASMELGSDDDWDEHRLQMIECIAEGNHGLASYVESRRGSREYVRHRGKWADAKTMKSVREMFGQCPSPLDPLCDCPAHTTARKFDLGALPQPFFTMKLISTEGE